MSSILTALTTLPPFIACNPVPCYRAAAMLRAVTFDLWETLVHEDPELEVSRRDYRVRETARILDAHGAPLPLATLEQAHQAVISRMAPFWSSNLDVSVIEQAKVFLEAAFGGPVDKKVPPAALLEIARHYGEAAVHFPPFPVAGALEVIRDAQERGLMVALVCNTGRTPGKVLRELLKLLGFEHCFHALYFSDEVRLRKPAKDLFDKALQRFVVAPGEALHVGDRIETDVAGARAAGMLSALLRTPGAPPPPPGAADYLLDDIKSLSAVFEQIAPPAGQTRQIRTQGETRHD